MKGVRRVSETERQGSEGKGDGRTEGGRERQSERECDSEGGG